MEKLVLITVDELKQIIELSVKNALIEYDKEKTIENDQHLYSINQVAHRLHLAHATVTKLVKAGVIKSTRTGKITAAALKVFLSTQ